MNLQSRKLSLIEEFLKISDESLIKKLESLIRFEKKKNLHKKTVVPLTLKKFYDSIDIAIKDAENGRVISHKQLKEKIKTWQ